MRCPSCKKGTLKVTHTYSVPSGYTQRRECDHCLVVATSTVLLTNIDPVRGQGAKAMATRLREPE